MSPFTVKIILDKGGAKDAIYYADDRELAKLGKLGEKLLCKTVYLNLTREQSPMQIICDQLGKVQRGRNGIIKIIFSFPKDKILSPQQMLRVIDRWFDHVSRCARLRMKRQKDLGLLPVDLRELVGGIAFHDNTKTPHAHVFLCPVHPELAETIRLAKGNYILAAAYARQEVLTETGFLAPQDRVYKLVIGKKGRPRIDVDERVRQRIVAKAVDGDSMDEYPYKAWRKRHPGRHFRRICDKYFPDGPVLHGSLAGTKQRMHEVLDSNNCCIQCRGGELTVVANTTSIKMKAVDDCWSKSAVERVTGLCGDWIIGRAQQEQTKIQTPELTERFVNNLFRQLKWQVEHHEIPWPEYRVTINHIGEQAHRRMTKEELQALSKAYWSAARSDQPMLTVGRAGDGQFRVGNIVIQPAVDGCQSFTVCGVPETELEHALELQPNLVVRKVGYTVPTGPGDRHWHEMLSEQQYVGLLDKPAPATYDVTYMISYSPQDRWQARNSMKMVAMNLVEKLRAAGYTLGFFLPGAPCWTPGIIGVPNIAYVPWKEPSRAVESMLIPAWEKLVEEERRDSIKWTRCMAKARGIDPDEAVAKLSSTSPARVTGFEQDVASEAIMQEMLRPVPPAAREKDRPVRDIEVESDESEAMPLLPPPPGYCYNPEDEDERRKQQRIKPNEPDFVR